MTCNHNDHTPDLFDRLTSDDATTSVEPAEEAPVQILDDQDAALGANGCICDQERFLSDVNVGRRYSISRQSVWRWLRNEADFPAPVKLSAGTTRWRLSDLARFERSRAAKGLGLPAIAETGKTPKRPGTKR